MDTDIPSDHSVITQFPHWPVFYWVVLVLGFICLICLMIAIKNVKKRRQRFGIESKDVTQEGTERASQTLSVIQCLDGCQNIITVKCAKCHEPIEGCSNCYKVYSPCSCGKQQSEEYKEQNEVNGAMHEFQRRDSVVSTISRKSSVHPPCAGGCQNVATLDCEDCHEPVQGCLDCHNVLSPCSCIAKQSEERTMERIENQKQQQIEEQNVQQNEEQNVESQHEQNENEEQNVAQSEKQSEEARPPESGNQINTPKFTVEYQRLNKAYRCCCEERKERDEQIKNLSADLKTSLKIVGNLTENLNNSTKSEMKEELQKVKGEASDRVQQDTEHVLQHSSQSARNEVKDDQQTQLHEGNEEISRQTNNISNEFVELQELEKRIDQILKIPYRMDNPVKYVDFGISQDFLNIENHLPQICQCHELADNDIRCQRYDSKPKRHNEVYERVLSRAEHHDPIIPVPIDIRNRRYQNRATPFRYETESASSNSLMTDVPEINDLSEIDMMREFATVSLEHEVQRRKSFRKNSCRVRKRNRPRQQRVTGSKVKQSPGSKIVIVKRKPRC